MIIRTDQPEWSVRVSVETDEVWRLPKYNVSKAARFVPEQLRVTWKRPDWPGGSMIHAVLSGPRRKPSGELVGRGAMVYATWSYYPDGKGWRNEYHLGERGAIPDVIRKFVEANTPPGLKLEP